MSGSIIRPSNGQLDPISCAEEMQAMEPPDGADVPPDVHEPLNGETKPDPAKLAQTAIIKQVRRRLIDRFFLFLALSELLLYARDDALQSASIDRRRMTLLARCFCVVWLSCFSCKSYKLLQNFSQDVMLSGSTASQSPAPSLTVSGNASAVNALVDSGLFVSVPSNDLETKLESSNANTLLGQPQVAPQLIVTGGGGGGVQHLLIPVSTSNGTQQLLSIPISLPSGSSGSHIQLLATSNGQLLAANIPNALGLSNGASTTTTSSTGLTQIITNSHGQLLAVAAPSNGTSHASSASSTSSTSSTNALTQQVISTISQGALASSALPPNVNQLLPNTISNSTESTTIDGINLDEIKDFAKKFKIWRLSMGLTQTQVGQALSAREGPAYSQSAICRFEKLDITPKSAQKIKPVLERWMTEAEERYKNGMQTLTEFIGSEPSKKRKRRTSFTPQALEVLNDHFERNTHPSGKFALLQYECSII